jgi:hypothetical protein
MNQTQIETVRKVFVVVQGGRRCLICEQVFTREEAPEHALVSCVPAPEVKRSQNCVRLSVLPSGSLNHAIIAPLGDFQMPCSSCTIPG